MEKLRSYKVVSFPTEEEIKNRFVEIEKLMSLKKNAFLNAANTNYGPASMRDFYLDPATKKL